MCVMWVWFALYRKVIWRDVSDICCDMKWCERYMLWYEVMWAVYVVIWVWCLWCRRDIVLYKCRQVIWKWCDLTWAWYAWYDVIWKWRDVKVMWWDVILVRYLLWVLRRCDMWYLCNVHDLNMTCTFRRNALCFLLLEISKNNNKTSPTGKKMSYVTSSASGLLET